VGQRGVIHNYMSDTWTFNQGTITWYWWADVAEYYPHAIHDFKFRYFKKTSGWHCLASIFHCTCDGGTHKCCYNV